MPKIDDNREYIVLNGEQIDELVRCKDCKYCSVDRYADGNIPDYVCIEMDCGVEPNGFCAWGEKREDAETKADRNGFVKQGDLFPQGR